MKSILMALVGVLIVFGLPTVVCAVGCIALVVMLCSFGVITWKTGRTILAIAGLIVLLGFLVFVGGCAFVVHLLGAGH